MATSMKVYPQTPLRSPYDFRYSIAEKFINNFVNYNAKIDGRRHSSAQNEKFALTNILKIFFDFGYILFYCPFRVEMNEKHKFVIKKFRPQQICCFFAQLMCTIRLITEVRISMKRESASNNPVQYFTIILDICSCVYKIVTMKRLWFNQNDYLSVLNYIRGNVHFKSKSVMTFKNVVFLRLFFGIIAVHSLASFIAGKNFLGNTSVWTPSLWRNQLVKLARYTFFVDDNFKKSDLIMLQTITRTDDFLAFLMALSMIERYIFGLFCDVFLLSFTMTLWIASKYFSQRVKQEEESEEGLWFVEKYNNDNLQRPQVYQTWSEVFDHFRSIQRLSIRINIALGSKVTWFLAEAIMYYSIYLNAVLTSTDAFVRVDLTVFYFNTFAILLFSADICNQLEKLKLWISYGENRKMIPKDELALVLHEMLAKDIGIRGSDIFTITYSLIALFCSTIVTYFIICIQQGHGISFLNQNVTLITSNKS